MTRRYSRRPDRKILPSGSEGKLNPTGKVTRAEVAKMLYMLSES